MKIFLLLLLFPLSAFAKLEPSQNDCLAQANDFAAYVYQNGIDSLPNGRSIGVLIKITDGEVLSFNPSNGEGSYEYSTAGKYEIYAGDHTIYKLNIWIQMNESCRIVKLRTQKKFLGY